MPWTSTWSSSWSSEAGTSTVGVCGPVWRWGSVNSTWGEPAGQALSVPPLWSFCDLRFCDSNEIYVATPSCDSEIFVVFCRTTRTVLLILFCVSDWKSQPVCDLVAICDCDFLRRDFGICDLKSLRFAIAIAHKLRSRSFLAHVNDSHWIS